MQPTPRRMFRLFRAARRYQAGRPRRRARGWLYGLAALLLLGELGRGNWIVSIVGSWALMAVYWLRHPPGADPIPLGTVPPSSGIAFEEATRQVLARAGWALQRTPASGDFGADLVGADPQHTRWVIQCKRWQGAVGVHAVQEVLGAKAYYHADRAAVITPSHYTGAAHQMAQQTGVVLIDGAGWRRLASGGPRG